MNKSIGMLPFCMVMLASLAGAHEYPLQFTPNAGYRGLVVAGYKFVGTNVSGNCSYYTVSGNNGSGKGGGGHTGVNKYYNQTCTWDQYGNLLSVIPGAPQVPQPLLTKGTETIYAQSLAGETTGTDSTFTERGFVTAAGSHYTWLTPASNAVLRQFVYTFSTVLKSDGDMPVDITAVVPSAALGAVTLKSTTCSGEIKVGATCSIMVTYDPTKITSTTETASDTFRIDLTSDAGEAHDFIQKFTIIVPEK